MPTLVIHPPNHRFRRFWQRRTPRLFEWIQVLAWLITDRKYGFLQGDLMRRLAATVDGPTHIEIETISRCDSTCAFCPVNRNDDPRPLRRMDDGLFRRIIDELADRDYRHRLNLFSNNEPFLDKRIFEFAAYARQRLPRAFLAIYTNGNALDEEKVARILPHLSSLIINNYDTRPELHDNVQAILSWLDSERPDLADRVTIRYRLLDEFKTNRGGDAPNRKLATPARSPCAYPFFQMIIRPDGKVSLCCADALGEVTLGDVAADGVWRTWENERRQEVRRTMLGGRGGLEKCRGCDYLGWSKPARLAAALTSPDLRGTYLTSIDRADDAPRSRAAAD